MNNIEQLETDLWAAADNLRANSKLTSSKHCMPVLGVIFLRHATNRYGTAAVPIAAGQAAGKMPKRALVKGDVLIPTAGAAAGPPMSAFPTAILANLAYASPFCSVETNLPNS